MCFVVWLESVLQNPLGAWVGTVVCVTAADTMGKALGALAGRDSLRSLRCLRRRGSATAPRREAELPELAAKPRTPCRRRRHELTASLSTPFQSARVEVWCGSRNEVIGRWAETGWLSPTQSEHDKQVSRVHRGEADEEREQLLDQAPD